MFIEFSNFFGFVRRIYTGQQDLTDGINVGSDQHDVADDRTGQWGHIGVWLQRDAEKVAFVSGA
jgi:hypothetical protein